MQAFVWDENFITGLDDVDEQHHSLVDLFNELNDRLFQIQRESNARRDAELQEVFDRLLSYAEHHFSEEEALMQQVGLDSRHILEHRSGHRQFVEQVRKMWLARHTLKNPSETIVGFLTAWLGLHILGVDQSMARQMAAIGDGVSATQAYEDEASHSEKATVALLKVVGNLYNVLARQNEDLIEANQQLEARVAERTRALQKANADLVNANQQLEVFSRTDALMGIANRAHFDERLIEELQRARRQQWPLSLVMIDVDHFKAYNDHYGHQAGDRCLQSIARAVDAALYRATDLLARYGGEELVVILPDTDAANAVVVAERLVRSVSALALPHATSPAGAVVTVSAGVATIAAGGVRLESQSDVAELLIQSADQALYRAKQAGRDRVEASLATV